MRKITTITGLIQELSCLLDKNVEFSIEEIYNHIENKDVIDWLEREFPFGSKNGLDFSMFKKKHRDWIHEELESIWGGYAGRESKWGIQNNGLCLLISWSIEIVRNIHGDSDPEENPEEWL